jgi:phosphopantothenoylcysteine synthetase/decarboxylase
MEKKSCDLMVLNDSQAIGSADNAVEVIDRAGEIVARWEGTKETVAARLFALIERRLIGRQ